MYYRSGSLITSSYVLIIWNQVLCLFFSILEIIFSLTLDIPDLDLYFSNFAPNNYTFLFFLKFKTAP